MQDVSGGYAARERAINVDVFGIQDVRDTDHRRYGYAAFVDASAMMCEWQSMIPGMTYCPPRRLQPRQEAPSPYRRSARLTVLAQNRAFDRSVGNRQDGGVLDQDRSVRRERHGRNEC